MVATVTHVAMPPSPSPPGGHRHPAVGDSRMAGASVLAMSVQLKELRERAASSTAALRAMTAQGDEVEALVQRKRSLKPLVVELRSEVRLPAAALAPPRRAPCARGRVARLSVRAHFTRRRTR